MPLFFGYFTFCPMHKSRHGCYRATHYKIVLARYLFYPTIRGFYIFQSQSFNYFINHFYLLANAVNQMKGTIRKHDSQWNSRKTTARTYIQYIASLIKTNKFSDAQRMQDMAQIKLINILSGNHINL